MSQALPPVPVRLSHPQWDWIALGLAVIVRQHQIGLSLGIYADARQIQAPKEKYDRTLAAMIAALAGRPASSSSRPSRTLDAVQIAACILATRISAMYLRHGHLPASRQPAGSPRRLLHRLENLRKRAKRAAQKHVPDQFREMQARWTGFVAWLRNSLLYCRCKQRRALRVSRRYIAAIFEQVVRLVRDALGRLRLRVRAQRERQLTSDVLRHVRRGRAWLSLRNLVGDPELSVEFLVQYLKTRLRRGNLYA